ncbi:transporter substrate-binding domain-containing protein [Epidermidibacterium keratini]|uniref:Transporter substrate-binding domain-containing protein n=1 Tax=Epidermidibacterium keratini TaxID=1891644 RepID=A0A7L4YTU4_9ACTN|nr:glutamate ABC transporter substrate-binding protein [Epidermidibacterium keratini]QHC01927.1 transporter substrate-binding domain-containing protein [Epidermidibacterium keratini]
MRRGLRAALCAVLALILTACASPGGDESETTTAPPPKFEDGTSVAALAQSGTIRIGVKTDLPGLGYQPSDASTPKGFDIEIAKIIAAAMDITPTDIQWVAVSSGNRMSMLTSGQVDLVIATFSMTDERMAQVGMAGPYFLTGQQIMTRSDDTSIAAPEDLAGKSVCQVAGSESANDLVDKYGAITTAYNSYSLCVDALLSGDLDAVSTDGAILQGFASEYPDDVHIVGEPFTTQRYGIGYPLGDVAMCQFLTDALLAAYSDGQWAEAFESTLGADGITAPVAPRPDDCPTG